MTFFAYRIRRRWILYNSAKELPSPRGLKPNAIVPYTLSVEARILAASDKIGGGKYHRSDARYEQTSSTAYDTAFRRP